MLNFFESVTTLARYLTVVVQIVDYFLGATDFYEVAPQVVAGPPQPKSRNDQPEDK